MRLRLPPYVQGFIDRHGKARYYFRKPGIERVPLPGMPHSPEFMAALAAASEGGKNARAEVGSDKTKPGTLNALAVAYFNSGEFKRLSESTQDTYRGIIDNFRSLNGERGIASLQRQHIELLMSNRAETPAAANNLLRMLRILMKFAIVHGWRKDDPTVGIRALKMRAGGFYTWSENDIAKFEAHHPVGSRARLALALLLYTAQRRSDVVRMGWQHIKNGALAMKQQKTGASIEIPIIRDLQAILDVTPKDNLTFLITAGGKPFSAAGFGNWFREACNKADLPKDCSAHGLRKAQCRRLAEAGCTPHEIMSITGHKSLREVTRYCDAANRKHLAKRAFEKTTLRTASVKPD